jgi:hypothetical protein
MFGFYQFERKAFIIPLRTVSDTDQGFAKYFIVNSLSYLDGIYNVNVLWGLLKVCVCENIKR